MKKYLELSLVMITGLLVSCAGEGYLWPARSRWMGAHDALRIWIWRDVYVDNISDRHWIADLFHCSGPENEGPDTDTE